MLYTLIGVHNLKNRIQAARNLLQETNFDQIIKEADLLAKSFLPEFVSQNQPKFPKIYFVVREPEAQVVRGIVFDISFLFDLHQFKVTLAHEFHHFYRAKYIKKHNYNYKDPLMYTLETYHREGVADLID